MDVVTFWITEAKFQWPNKNGSGAISKTHGREYLIFGEEESFSCVKIDSSHYILPDFIFFPSISNIIFMYSGSNLDSGIDIIL